MKSLTLLLIALAAVTCHASAAATTPTPISYSDATNLFVALSSLEPGLTPDNAIVAADDITALEKHVKALDKAKQAAQRQARKAMLLPAGAEQNAAVEAAEDTLTAIQDAPVKEPVDLAPLAALTPDEIKDSKIVPRNLAIIRQYLQPQPKKQSHE